MEERITAPKKFNDPVAETLHLLKPTGILYCQSELTAPWGVTVPPLENVMMFQIVNAGCCWLEIDGLEPRLLQQGSFTLIPHGNAHSARSAPDVQCEPLFDIPINKVSDRLETMQYGGGGQCTQITYGVLRIDHIAAQHLIRQLPKLLHIDAWSEDAGNWLQSTIRLIAREAGTLRPGGETVITHLSDILVIQAIRSWLDNAPEARQGWLAALRDPQIGRAMGLIHQAPQKSWSVERLAREVGMSRSAFSARFTNIVGEPAMHYVSDWRMQLARKYLRETSQTLAVIANRLGYRSEAAFCRAFKRAFEVTPGSLRRQLPAERMF